jgi:hypothetical protein
MNCRLCKKEMYKSNLSELHFCTNCSSFCCYDDGTERYRIIHDNYYIYIYCRQDIVYIHYYQSSNYKNLELQISNKHFSSTEEIVKFWKDIQILR